MQPHRLDYLSLAFGVVFVLIALLGLVDVLTISVVDLRWLLPGVLIVVGVALLVGGSRRGEAPGATESDDAR